MTTELTAQQRFEQNIFERLREDVGKLLPDEVLAEMTKRAMEKMFFEPRKILDKARSYSSHTYYIDKPSWFETYVEEALRTKANELAGKWLEENRARLVEMFTKTMTATMPALVAEAIFKPIDNAIANSEMNTRNAVAEYVRQQLTALPR